MRGTKHCLAKLDRIIDGVKDDVPNRLTQYTDMRATIAQNAYETAQYDGDNDVTVTASNDGNEWDITASGQALLFIEYGTGYHYPHNNPIDDPRNDAGLWSLMKGKGFLFGKKFLKYKGFWPLPGTDRWVDGNPSANIMYQASKYVREQVPEEVAFTLNKAIKS